MKKIIIPVISALIGVVAFAIVSYLQIPTIIDYILISIIIGAITWIFCAPYFLDHRHTNSFATINPGSVVIIVTIFVFLLLFGLQINLITASILIALAVMAVTGIYLYKNHSL